MWQPFDALIEYCSNYLRQSQCINTNRASKIHHKPITQHVSGRYLLISTALWAKCAISFFNSFTNNKFEKISRLSSRYGSTSWRFWNIDMALSTSAKKKKLEQWETLCYSQILTSFVVIGNRNLRCYVNASTETYRLQFLEYLQSFIVEEQFDEWMANKDVSHPMIR